MTSVPLWLKALTYGMGVLIIVLSAVLIGELARRAFFAGPGPEEAARLSELSLAGDERIAQIAGGDQRTTVLIEQAGGAQRLVVLDHVAGTVADWPIAIAP